METKSTLLDPVLEQAASHGVSTAFLEGELEREFGPMAPVLTTRESETTTVRRKNACDTGRNGSNRRMAESVGMLRARARAGRIRLRPRHVR